MQPGGHVRRTLPLLILGQVCHLRTAEQQLEPVLAKLMAEPITLLELDRLTVQNRSQDLSSRRIGGSRLRHGRVFDGTSPIVTCRLLPGRCELRLIHGEPPA